MSPTSDLLAHPLLRQRACYAHWVPERVRWSDTDMAGHANNLAFAAFAEAGRALLLRQFMAVGATAETRALLVLAEMRLKYLGEAHWPEEISVGTCVTSISTRACRMAQGLFVEDRCIGVVESVLVNIDERSRKSSEIPASVRRVLESWLQPALRETAVPESARPA